MIRFERLNRNESKCDSVIDFQHQSIDFESQIFLNLYLEIFMIESESDQKIFILETFRLKCFVSSFKILLPSIAKKKIRTNFALRKVTEKNKKK